MRFKKYLREVSVVIIGVTVTLIATSWLSSTGEKKDLQLYLSAVRLELEDNLKLLQEAEVYFSQTYSLRDYLRKNKLEDLKIDSLRQYRRTFENYYFFIYKTGAFDMLKTSGAMRLIKNKELLLDIWNSYSGLENYKAEHDHYMNMKSSVMSNVMLHESEDYKQLESVGILLNPKQKQARMLYLLHSDIGDLENCIEQVKKTLERFGPALR